VFVVVAALAVMGIMTGPTGGHNVISTITHAFLDALLLASVAGALWARLLAWLQGQALSYMLTLAAILILYEIAEIIGANGAMTILLFGLVLGNMETLVGHLARPLRTLIGYRLDQTEFALDEFLKRLNEELSFLVRTFFYVLLGLIVVPAKLTWIVLGAGLGMFTAILLTRWLVTEVFGRAFCGWGPDQRSLIIAMLPRGVAVAVMSFLPASAGIAGTDLFPVYALTVIVLSIVFMTVAFTLFRQQGTASILAPAKAAEVPEASS
jgi:cell volume regulation protein A